MFREQQHSEGWQRQRLPFLLLIPVFILVLAAAVQFLWNAILPEVTHAGIISYWQSLGLLALCRILVGGFGHGGRSSRPRFGRPPLMNEKWMEMSSEEKQKFREEWRSRCEHRNP